MIQSKLLCYIRYTFLRSLITQEMNLDSNSTLLLQVPHPEATRNNLTIMYKGDVQDD